MYAGLCGLMLARRGLSEAVSFCTDAPNLERRSVDIFRVDSPLVRHKRLYLFCATDFSTSSKSLRDTRGQLLYSKMD